jgi:hypothetical protein
MTVLPKVDPRKLLGACAALGLALSAAAGIGARADELIRFKNGHSLAVRSSSVEGEVVGLTNVGADQLSVSPEKVPRLTVTVFGALVRLKPSPA